MATPSNQQRVRFKTPALCHKSFKAPPEIQPGALPPSLNGWASWIDPDPLTPARFTSTLRARKASGPNLYVGVGPGDLDFFEIGIFQDPFSQLWNCILILHGQRDPPEEYNFAAITIDLTKPFDTGLLTEHPAQPSELRQLRMTF